MNKNSKAGEDKAKKKPVTEKAKAGKPAVTKKKTDVNKKPKKVTE